MKNECSCKVEERFIENKLVNDVRLILLVVAHFNAILYC